MQNLFDQLNSRCSLSKSLEQRVEQYFLKVSFKKGDLILSQGHRANFLYFIQKGVLHSYHFQKEKQISSWFYHENQFITSWYSFYTQQPSYEEIECLEDSSLYQISYNDFQKLIEDSKDFGNFARILAEEMIVFIDKFSKEWSFLQAKEKYQLLLQYFPNIEQRVQLGYIASFLGISQETLSRIRR